MTRVRMILSIALAAVAAVGATQLVTGGLAFGASSGQYQYGTTTGSSGGEYGTTTTSSGGEYGGGTCRPHDSDHGRPDADARHHDGCGDRDRHDHRSGHDHR